MHDSADQNIPQLEKEQQQCSSRIHPNPMRQVAIRHLSTRAAHIFLLAFYRHSLFARRDMMFRSITLLSKMSF